MECSNGHPMREASRRLTREVREDVVYVRQRIKHFNREGSEFWAEIDVPDIVERMVEIEIVEYRCDDCREVATVRQERGGEAAGAD